MTSLQGRALLSGLIIKEHLYLAPHAPGPKWQEPLDALVQPLVKFASNTEQEKLCPLFNDQMNHKMTAAMLRKLLNEGFIFDWKARSELTNPFHFRFLMNCVKETLKRPQVFA